MTGGARANFAAAWVALPLIASGAPAAAQSVESNDPGGVLQEVVVNARRVSERLQDVPIAINVINDVVRQRLDVRSFQDLVMHTPGLSMCCGRGWLVDSVVTMRGAVGVVSYFAEAPVQLFGGRGLMFDISDVQVLKGPQGTLFGVATNGGAILTQPRKPSTEYEGYGEVTVGTYGRQMVEGALNVPLLDDRLLVRAAVTTVHTDGIARRRDTGERLGEESYWAARLSLTARPTDRLENYLVANYYSSDENIYFSVLRSINPNSAAARVFGADTLQALLDEQRALGTYSKAGDDQPSFREEQQWNIVNTTTYDLTDAIALKNIFSYEWRHSFGSLDRDGTRLPIGSVSDSDPRTLSDPSTHQHLKPFTAWTEELQLAGKQLWDKLDFQVGFFYRDAVVLPGNIEYQYSSGTLGATITRTTNDTRALYSQINYDLSGLLDGLSLTVGYRYTWDRVATLNRRLTLETLQSNRDLYNAADFSSGSYTFGLQYRYSPDVMFFLTNSQGYSKGGFNLTAPPQFQVYQPESLNNIELGVKSQFVLGSVPMRANVSLFYGWYDDKQVGQSLLAQLNPPPAPLSLLTVTSNAASAKPRGFDLDLAMRPFDSLEVSGTLTYTRAKYDEFDTVDGQGNPGSKAGLEFLRVHKWQGNAHVTYFLPISPAAGELSASVDYAWYSREIVDSSAFIPDPQYYLGYWPPRESLNASLRWENVMGREGLVASVYGTNLTEQDGNGGGYCSYTALGICTESPAQPRMFGVRLRYNF